MEVGDSVLAWWPGGQGSKRGWLPATITEVNQRKKEAWVRWGDGYRSLRKLDKLRYVDNPAKPFTVSDLESRDRWRKKLGKQVGVYAYSTELYAAQPAIVKVGCAVGAGGLQARIADFELAHIATELILYGFLICQTGSDAHRAEQQIHAELREKDMAYAGRFRETHGVRRTEWFLQSSKEHWSAIHEAFDRAAKRLGPSAYVVWDIDGFEKGPPVKTPRDVGVIIGEKADDLLGGVTYKVIWEGEDIETAQWVHTTFFLQEPCKAKALYEISKVHGDEAEIELGDEYERVEDTKGRPVTPYEVEKLAAAVNDKYRRLKNTAAAKARRDALAAARLAQIEHGP